MMMPHPSEEVQAIRDQEIVDVPDAVGEALKYVPEEAPRQGDLPVPKRLPIPKQAKTGVQASLAVTVYSLFSMSLPYKAGPGDEQAELRVSYKITKSQNVHLPNIYISPAELRPLIPQQRTCILCVVYLKCLIWVSGFHRYSRCG